MWHLSPKDQYLLHHFPANQCTFSVNMNRNQAFCITLVIFLLQSISIQQQQMVEFFTLYMRWIHFSYQAMLNIAMIRRRNWRLRQQHITLYAGIPRPAESWFEIHYNDPTVPQEYFRQQLRVYKNTLDLIHDTLNARIVRENSKFRDCLPPKKAFLSPWTTCDDISDRGFLCLSEILKNLPAPPILYGVFWSFQKFENFCYHTKVEVAYEHVVCWQILTLM